MNMLGPERTDGEAHALQPLGADAYRAQRVAFAAPGLLSALLSGPVQANGQSGSSGVC